MKPMTNDQLRETAARIVEHLPGYHLAPGPPEEERSYDRWTHLVTSLPYVRGNTKGLEIHNSIGRLSVGCLWPSDGPHGYGISPRDPKSITVAADRPAEAIAKDSSGGLLEAGTTSSGPPCASCAWSMRSATRARPPLASSALRSWGLRRRSTTTTAMARFASHAAA